MSGRSKSSVLLWIPGLRLQLTGSILHSQTWPSGPSSQLTPLGFLEDTCVEAMWPVSDSHHLGTILISLMPIAPHFNHMTMPHWWLLCSGHKWWNYNIIFNDCFLFIIFSASHKHTLAISCIPSFISTSLLLTKEKDLLTVFSQLLWS